MAEGELKIEHGAENETANPAPGQVIAPGNSQAPAKEPASAEPVPQVQQPANTQPTPLENAQPIQAAAPPQIETSIEAPYAPESSQPPISADGEISWTASEFIAHEKSAGWYLGLAVVGFAVAALVFLITRDYISAVVVLVGAFALGVLGAKQPKQQQYKLDNGGLTIGQKHYEYHAFKSFAVVPEGAFSSIVFMPLKRFAPLITIYYPPEDEPKITTLLANHLPLEPHKLDAVDHLMQRIRF